MKTSVSLGLCNTTGSSPCSRKGAVAFGSVASTVPLSRPWLARYAPFEANARSVSAFTKHDFKSERPCHTRRRWCTYAAASAAPAAASTSIQTNKHRFWTSSGAIIDCTVEHVDQTYTISIDVDRTDASQNFEPPVLHWGMYRASPTKWHHPKDVLPPGSALDTATGAMRSPLSPGDDLMQHWQLRMTVPSKMAPLQLGLVLYYPSQQVYDGPQRGGHFTIPVGMSPGDPTALGPTLVAVQPPSSGSTQPTCSVNFAVFARNASAISLCLMRRAASGEQATGYLEVALDPLTNKTGDVWHVCVHGLKDLSTLCYGWRAAGHSAWEDGSSYHPGFLMLDPYCPLAEPVLLPDAAYAAAPVNPPGGPLTAPILQGSLAYVLEDYRWGSVRPRTPLEASCFLEVDLLGWAYDGAVTEERRGLATAVLERLPFIQASGATAVVLPAAQLRGSQAHCDAPLSFFAPNLALGRGSGLEASRQLKQLVDGLHQAGLEVLLQVEFCLTAEEGEEFARLQSLQGLDGDVYYRAAGTAVLNTGHAVVRRMVLDALRHWATEYQVDGFCFVKAENMGGGRFGGVLDAPATAEAICYDPVLQGLKLVAVSNDDGLLPRGGERGFPHWGRWMEWNSRFTGDLWAAVVNGAPGMASALATRITGSMDLFAARWDAGLPGNLAAGRRPCFGVNGATALGSGPLLELLLAGGADLARAETLARTLLLASILSQGTPCLSAATLQAPSLLSFAGLAVELKRAYSHLLSPVNSETTRTISWHGATSNSQPDWSGEAAAACVPGANYMACCLRDVSGRALYWGVNGHEEAVTAELPALGAGMVWRRVVDTALLPPDDIHLGGGAVVAGAYLVVGKSAVVFEAVVVAGGGGW